MKKYFMNIVLLVIMSMSFQASYASSTDVLFDSLFAKEVKTIEKKEVAKPKNLSVEKAGSVKSIFTHLENNTAKYSSEQKIAIYDKLVKKLNTLILSKNSKLDKSSLIYLRDLIKNALEITQNEVGLFEELFGTEKILCAEWYKESKGKCIKNDSDDTNWVPKKICYVSNGYGNQFWYETYRSKCYVINCNKWYTISNGSCIVDNNNNSNYYNNNNYYNNSNNYWCNDSEHYEDNRCVSNNKSCILDNWYWRQNWYGTYWGNCYADSCNSWYIISNGKCVLQNNNNSNNCYSDQHYENGYCVSNTKYCNISNGSGKQTWYGNNWSECRADSCNSWYYIYNWYCTPSNNNCGNSQHYENGYCVSNTRNCSLNNGEGTQTWNGSYWGSCYANYCDNDYTLSNGNCIKKWNCTYDQHYEDGYCVFNTRYCEISNGTGKQTWYGNYWSDCSAYTCNSWYYIYNWYCTR